LYEDVRWQKSVRRIARHDARRAARQVGGAALAQGRSAWRADARSGGLPRGENGARSCVTLSATRQARPRRPGQPGRSGHDGRRSDLHAFVPQGAGAGRSWSRGSTPGCRSHREVRRGPDKLRCRQWNRWSGARADDEGRQTPATCMAKAAPANEARAVRHSRRREAPAFDKAHSEVSRSMREQDRDRESHARVGRSWPERKQGHPSHEARTARTESGRAGALTPYRRMRGSRRAHTTDAGYGSARSTLIQPTARDDAPNADQH